MFIIKSNRRSFQGCFFVPKQSKIHENKRQILFVFVSFRIPFQNVCRPLILNFRISKYKYLS